MKYVDKTYNLLVGHFGLSPEWPLPFSWWDSYFEHIDIGESEDEQSEERSNTDGKTT
jgi:hypothetical protein